MFHLKIYEIISDSFCVFPLEHFDVSLNILTVVGHVQYGFLVKIFPNFYDQIKRKASNGIGSILPPRIKNPWKLFKQNRPKGVLSFWKVKILGGLNKLVKTQLRISYA